MQKRLQPEREEQVRLCLTQVRDIEGGMYILCLFIGIINIWCIKSQVVTITVVPLNDGVTLTCRLFNETGNENGIRWYQVDDPQGVTYVESPTTPGACLFFAGGSAYNLTRFTTTCNAAQNNYTLSFTVLHADVGKSWCCSYVLPSSIGCEDNVTIQGPTTNSTTITSPQPWYTLDWCLGLIAYDGIFVLAVIVGIIIFCRRRTYIKKHKHWKKAKNAIIILVVFIIAINGVLTWFACNCWNG